MIKVILLLICLVNNSAAKILFCNTLIGSETNLVTFWNFEEGTGDFIYGTSIETETNGIINGATYSEDVLQSCLPLTASQSGIQGFVSSSFQTIPLNENPYTDWDMISTYMNSNEDVESIMSPILNNFIIIKDASGLVYWPAIPVSTLDNLNTQEAYAIKTWSPEEINVLGDFGILSIYCFCYEYMGGQNLLQYVSNYYTTTTDVIQDLSSLFFNTITPNKNIFNILININANLYSSYALEERITVELWRDLSMLTKSNNLGSVIATGGLTIPYNFTYIDSPNTNTLLKYYLKYQLENNNSSQEMGIINIQNDLNYGHSNIILREL